MHIKALKLLCIFFGLCLLVPWFSWLSFILSLLSCSNLGIRTQKKKKRSSWLGAVSRILQNLSLSISFLPSLPSPPFLSFSDSNLHVTNQNAIQAFHKR